VGTEGRPGAGREPGGESWAEAIERRALHQSHSRAHSHGRTCGHGLISRDGLRGPRRHPERSAARRRRRTRVVLRLCRRSRDARRSASRGRRRRERRDLPTGRHQGRGGQGGIRALPLGLYWGRRTPNKVQPHPHLLPTAPTQHTSSRTR
jgi:hypothetical protein